MTDFVQIKWKIIVWRLLLYWSKRTEGHKAKCYIILFTFDTAVSCEITRSITAIVIITCHEQNIIMFVHEFRDSEEMDKFVKTSYQNSDQINTKYRFF